MDIQEREELTHLGDIGLKACAIRLHTARLMTGMKQADLAIAAGVKKTTYNNMETGVSYPSRKVMRYYFRVHNIDFNFLMHGEFSHYPPSVQDQIFQNAKIATSEWDQRHNSN